MIFQSTEKYVGQGRHSNFILVVRAILRLLRPLVLALILFLVVRALFLEAFKIPTSSMESTLLPGDFVLVNKAVYGKRIPLGFTVPGWSDPQRGDIVVFQPPHDPGRNYVKRVIGQPGDTVTMVDRVIFVNGDILKEDYLRDSVDQGGSVDVRHSDMRWQKEYWIDKNNPATDAPRAKYDPSRDNWGPLSIPAGKFFVLGDNREDSEDSRYWGFVSRTSIDGKAWVIYYSTEPGYHSYRGWLDAVRWDRIGRRID